MSRWKVDKAYGLWYAYEYGWKRHETFTTWAKAMHYADQQARTIEVTLPRVVPHPDYGYLVDPDDPWVYSWGGRWHLAPIGDWDSHAALLCNDVGEYKIYAGELKPLALALLAHAERIGE